MPANRSSSTAQTVRVGIDVGEVLDSREYTAYRKDIDRGGTPGVFDGNGSAIIRINGQGVILIHLRESADGVATLEVSGLSPKSAPVLLGAMNLEKPGLVPARPTKENR